jgi:hypothetical protein
MEWTAVEPTDVALGLWFEAWIDGFIRFFTASMVSMVLVALAIVLIGAWTAATVRRRFWCRMSQREVEVLFERRGLLRSIAAVRSCSAFEPPTCVACERRCLDARYRRQWEPALPVRMR